MQHDKNGHALHARGPANPNPNPYPNCTSYPQAAIDRETGAGGGSILVRGIADAGKALRGMRRDLLEAQGKNPDEIDKDKEEGQPEAEDDEVDSNLDDFLTLLETIDPDATKSDQGLDRIMSRVLCTPN